MRNQSLPLQSILCEISTEAEPLPANINRAGPRLGPGGLEIGAVLSAAGPATDGKGAADAVTLGARSGADAVARGALVGGVAGAVLAVAVAGAGVVGEPARERIRVKCALWPILCESEKSLKTLKKMTVSGKGKGEYCFQFLPAKATFNPMHQSNIRP